MADIGQIIRENRIKRGLSQTELAKRANMSKQSISMYESGSRTPSYTAIEAIVDVLNIKMSDVLTPEERKQGLEAEKKARERLPKAVTPVPDVPHHYVPLMGSVSCGNPLFAQECYDVVIDAPRKADYALKVEGDSMTPTFMPGDIVYIHQQDDVDDGDIGVVLLDDSVVLKHIFHSHNGLTVVSDNPHYPPKPITRDDYEYIRILGKVCGFTRMW